MEYRHQINLGLDQDPGAARKVRVILRKLLGPIDLRPGPEKNLQAHYEACPAALIKVGKAGASTDGSGCALIELYADRNRAVSVGRLTARAVRPECLLFSKADVHATKKQLL